MRLVHRSAALGAATLCLVLAFQASARAIVLPLNKCLAGKIKCVSKKKSCLLGVDGKAFGAGILDVAKHQHCKDKYDGGADPSQGCFAKLEAKGGCLTTGDSATLEAKVDALETDVVGELAPGGYTINKCAGGKFKCVAKKDKCILGAYAKAAKIGGAPDPTKLQKCKDKYDGGADPAKGCFAKLEAKPPCLTTGDTAALEAKVDAFDTDVIGELLALPATCPTAMKFTPTSTTGILDVGWTGLGHDSTVVSKGTVTVDLTACQNATPPCGVCSYAGPVENGPGEIHAQRCKGNSAIECLADADCGADAPCVFYYGTYLPIAAGGVSSCVANSFVGSISGTVNVDSGTGGQRAGTAIVNARVYSGPLLAEPCPQCNSDMTANDGVQGGTCDFGARAGMACDASGSSPNPAWGTTSLDCPPFPGALIASLTIDLSDTTGTKTRTLSVANPTCRAPGFNGPTSCGGAPCRCQCDTCATAAAEPCSSDADCPGGATCGGKRCRTGANDGAPCAVASECPGGSCSVPGLATAPNQCDGGSGDCAGPDNVPATSANDKSCLSGPLEQFCGPTESFRACIGDGDCPAAGDTCSINRFRECYDNGLLGDTVLASGNADPWFDHKANPTLATLFCIGPTTSSAVNATTGFPGLGRLELREHATDNGTP